VNHQVTITIGGLPIVIRCARREFIAMLEVRYGNFIATSQAGSLRPAGIRLEVDLVPPLPLSEDQQLHVIYESGRWLMRRGDFLARWDPAARRGFVRQAAYPYAIDSVMRIIHSLVLARGGGFLLHSASAVRGGRAFLFAGVSGAGKTTISRLAPPDAALLSDEISYVRRVGDEYHAFGTPFAGELGIAGENIAAPIGALFLLDKGPRNSATPIAPGPALRSLMRNVLFFANDHCLAGQVFATACDFVARVAVHRLTFRPEPDVWSLVA
jgi:hypothetical protein